MKKTWHLAAALLTAPLLAHAQLSNLLSGAMGSGSSGTAGLGSLGGLSSSSLGAAAPTNLAGIIQYCVQNNDLPATGGSDASTAPASVQQSLLDKFTGSPAAPTNNSGYTNGANGLLNTGNGQTVALGGTGLKAQITQKVCAQVLQHAKSML